MFLQLFYWTKEEDDIGRIYTYHIKQLHQLPVEHELLLHVEEVKAHFMDLSNQCELKNLLISYLIGPPGKIKAAHWLRIESTGSCAEYVSRTI